MRLSDRQSHVFSCFELSALADAAQAARATGLREHTVRYCMKRMEDEGIIRFHPELNLARAGLSTYRMLLSFSPGDGSACRRFLQALEEHPQITAASEYIGLYDLGLTIVVRDFAELVELFDETLEISGVELTAKEVGRELSAVRFPRKYLSDRSAADRCLMISREQGAFELDQLDRTILDILRSGKAVSAGLIARTIGSSDRTVCFRLNRLKKEKVISAFTYELMPERLGLEQVRVLLSVKRLNAANKEKLLSFALSHRRVTRLERCFGDWDYEIVLEVERNSELLDFKEELQQTFGGAIGQPAFLVAAGKRPTLVSRARDELRQSKAA
jgi:DNA-binding Lrp family transcriptional regulator